MKTETDIETKITNITIQIQADYPELSKFIKEMPVNISENVHNGVNNSNMEEYYNSLLEMIATYSESHSSSEEKDTPETVDLPGYPHYPPSEDIYTQGKKEIELNPEDVSKKKITNNKNGLLNEKTFKEDKSGDDLDVPGAELDDQQESVGSEDEENNYYSLGGDNHNDLEEDKE